MGLTAERQAGQKGCRALCQEHLLACHAVLLNTLAGSFLLQTHGNTRHTGGHS